MKIFSLGKLFILIHNFGWFSKISDAFGILLKSHPGKDIYILKTYYINPIFYTPTRLGINTICAQEIILWYLYDNFMINWFNNRRAPVFLVCLTDQV